MPSFDDNPLQHLALLSADAEVTLDLRGLDHDTALNHVTALIETPEAGSYLIRFDGARNDGVETLFQPLGRQLLAARKAGQLTRCLPIPDGDGYYIEFPGQISDEKAD